MLIGPTDLDGVEALAEAAEELEAVEAELGVASARRASAKAFADREVIEFEGCEKEAEGVAAAAAAVAAGTDGRVARAEGDGLRFCFFFDFFLSFFAFFSFLSFVLFSFFSFFLRFRFCSASESLLLLLLLPLPELGLRRRLGERDLERGFLFSVVRCDLVSGDRERERLRAGDRGISTWKRKEKKPGHVIDSN